MPPRRVLLRPSLVLWGLLFVAAWTFTTHSDWDTFWLAPGFFLPQFLLVAGLCRRPVTLPWPWLGWMMAALPAAAVLGLSGLFTTGSVLEALGTQDRVAASAVFTAAGLYVVGGLAFFLTLRRRPRRQAARILLGTLVVTVLLQAAVSAVALPFALRQGDFLAGLVCHLSLAMAATTLVWTVPGWIAALLLPASAADDEGRSR